MDDQLSRHVDCKGLSEADANPKTPSERTTDTLATPAADVTSKAARSAEKAPAELKIAKEEKSKKDKVPRGKNAFMHFVCAKRSETAGEHFCLCLVLR